MLMQVASCRNRLAEPRGPSDNLLRQPTPALPVPLARPAGPRRAKKGKYQGKNSPVHFGVLPDGINKDLAKRTRKAAALPAPRFAELDTFATATPSKLTMRQNQELGASVLPHIEPRGGKINNGRTKINCTQGLSRLQSRRALECAK